MPTCGIGNIWSPADKPFPVCHPLQKGALTNKTFPACQPLQKGALLTGETFPACQPLQKKVVSPMNPFRYVSLYKKVGVADQPPLQPVSLCKKVESPTALLICSPAFIDHGSHYQAWHGQPHWLAMPLPAPTVPSQSRPSHKVCRKHL
jgi:hypothetical protein